MAQLTRTKRTDVVKNAIAVYHWFLRHTITGARVARRPTGEEITFETEELAVLAGEEHRLSPEELGLLAKRLAKAENAADAAQLRERLTRGFYGI